MTLSTPERGEAETASCPSSVSFAMTCDPMSPVPPMTKIFMIEPFEIECRVWAPGTEPLLDSSAGPTLVDSDACTASDGSLLDSIDCVRGGCPRAISSRFLKSTA